MRHLSVTRNAKGGSFRVLLIDETTADRALVEAAIGADVSIDAASGRDLTIGTAFAPEARPDIVLIGRRAREPTALIDELKTADPRLPVILLSGDRSSASAGELDAHAATDDPRAFAAAIASTLAGAARARAAEIEELRRREERARFVIMLTDSARGLESPHELAELTMQQLRERLGADRCVYGNVDADARASRTRRGRAARAARASPGAFRSPGTSPT